MKRQHPTDPNHFFFSVNKEEIPDAVRQYCQHCFSYGVAKVEPGRGVRKREKEAWANRKEHIVFINPLSLFSIRQAFLRYKRAYRSYDLANGYGVRCYECEKKKWGSKRERKEAAGARIDDRHNKEFSKMPLKMQRGMTIVQGRFDLELYRQTGSAYAFEGEWEKRKEAAALWCMAQEMKRTLKEFKKWRGENEPNYADVHGKQLADEETNGREGQFHCGSGSAA